jgi:preprotein translocase subunit SecG
LEQPVGFDVFTAAMTVHISMCYMSHIDEFGIVLLHPGDDKEVKQSFYATSHSLMMGVSEGRNMQELTYYAIIVILTNCVHFLLFKIV